MHFIALCFLYSNIKTDSKYITILSQNYMNLRKYFDFFNYALTLDKVKTEVYK